MCVLLTSKIYFMRHQSTKSMYSTSQEILYIVCIAAWNLCKQNLEKFTALKAFYTEAFITNALQTMKDAKNLPESIHTIAKRKEARINLMKSTKNVRANWQVLKVYITKAFDPSLVKTKLDAAGKAMYAKASVDNWSAVRSLIDTANVFIAANLKELKANENMPKDFQAKFKAAGDACVELYKTFASTNLDKEMATSVKMDANNAVYASLIEMLKDGYQIFTNDTMIRKQFTFSYLVSMHKGERPASLKGYLVNHLQQPVVDAVIESKNQKYKAITNNKGHYRISRIATGSYPFTITCPGYQPLDLTINFVAGVATKGDYEMSAQMKKVA